MKIKKITRSQFKGQVFNLGTLPCHNYYAEGVLVHNCYQDSTLEGRHADKKFIEDLCFRLEDMEVFEVALGGGETTLHPHFAEFLYDFHNRGIVPNFTTRNPNWIKNDTIRKAVAETAGRFAYSVDNAMDMYRVYMNIESAGLLNIERSGGEKRLSFQLVMGSGSEDQFIEAVRAAAKLGCDLTLLGYKEVGRGKTYRPWDYKNWFEVLKKMRKNEYLGNIGIDTALAQQSKAELEKEKLQTLVTYEEGTFSMYIDAVDLKMGPSSFCGEEEYIPFDMTSGPSRREPDIEAQIRCAYNGFGKKTVSKKQTQGV